MYGNNTYSLQYLQGKYNNIYEICNKKKKNTVKRFGDEIFAFHLRTVFTVVWTDV